MLDIAALSDTRVQLSVREIAITDQTLCARALDSLPREYECGVRHFQSALTPTTLDRIEQIVREGFVSLQSEKSKKRQSLGHALYAGDAAIISRALYAGDAASISRGGSGRGNSGSGGGRRGRGNASSNEGGSNSFGGRASGVRIAASANDGCTAVTRPDGDTSKKYCALCHKHGHWRSRCPGQVRVTCKGTGQRMFAHQENMPFSPTSAPISTRKSFDAIVAKTGEASQANDTPENTGCFVRPLQRSK